MARTAKKEAEATEAQRSAEGLLPARELDWRRVVTIGLAGGLTASFLSAIGMVQEFSQRDVIGELTLGYILLIGVPLAFGYMAAKPPPQLEGYEAAEVGGKNLLAGALAGLLAAAVTAVFVILVGNFDIRGVFPNISPEMIDLLTFARGLALGSLLLLGAGAVLGAVGGAMHVPSRRLRRSLFSAALWVVLLGLLESFVIQVVRNSIGLVGEGPSRPLLIRVLYGPGGELRIITALVVAVVAFGVTYWLGGRQRTFRQRFDRATPRGRLTVAIVLAIVLLALAALGPPILGRFWSNVLVTSGIFLIMALGLNIVVGFAGLLDLGYVAFFAVGAYTTAILTHEFRPTDPLTLNPEWNFWMAIPFVMMAAALAGMIVGTPVLRMRGDYLAIVTLGFGEITRILFLSDWLKDTVGGARGIRGIPPIPPEQFNFSNPQWFLYVVIIFVLIAAYASWALQDSRVGRAWMAMREDESVAEVMGVNTVSAKLWAFMIGAILASFGGALFASKVFSVFPHSFEIQVSLQILIIVIVGGMGSMKGVMVAALLLIAVPQALREFDVYRFLIYGALLIYMMLRRPEGLIPSRRRAAELHEDELSQDAWLKREEPAEEPASKPAGR